MQITSSLDRGGLWAGNSSVLEVNSWKETVDGGGRTFYARFGRIGIVVSITRKKGKVDHDGEVNARREEDAQ